MGTGSLAGIRFHGPPLQRGTCPISWGTSHGGTTQLGLCAQQKQPQCPTRARQTYPTQRRSVLEAPGEDNQSPGAEARSPLQQGLGRQRPVPANPSRGELHGGELEALETRLISGL